MHTTAIEAMRLYCVYAGTLWTIKKIKMKKTYLIIIILSIISFSVRSQNLCELFFGGEEYEKGESFQQTLDGGFIITGDTESFSNGLYDIYLLKLDLNGNLIWQNSFGGTSSDNGNHVIQTQDGGYMIAGYSVQDNDRKYLRKVSETGTLEWEKGYPSGSIKSIIQLSDGNYIFAGDDWSQGNKQVDIAKISSTGEIIWENLFGGAEDDNGREIVIAADGGFVIVGESRSNSSGAADVYVIKVDENGSLVWEKKIGGGSWDFANDIKATLDGGFIITGIQDPQPFQRDAYLVKIDSEGEVEWENNYGGSSSELGEGVIETSDGGFAFIGKTQSTGNGGSDLYFVKTDADGTVEWEKTFGGSSTDSGFDLLEMEQGGYALLGTTRSFGAGSYDVYFIKTDENGEVLLTSTIDIEQNEILIDVFPNPSISDVSFKINDKVKLPIKLKITTTVGEVIIDKEVSNYEFKIESNLLEKGILFYSFFGEHGHLKSGNIIIK